MRNREIERKFLVVSDEWRTGVAGLPCRQGYLLFGPPVSVRIRAMGAKGYLTIKRAGGGDRSNHAPVERDEYEYEIPRDEAEALLDTACGETVEKTRYLIPHGGRVWEVDEFRGRNAGLVVAEIELEDAEMPFEKPSWAGDEVSDDPRYLNVNLARHPFGQWQSS